MRSVIIGIVASAMALALAACAAPPPPTADLTPPPAPTVRDAKYDLERGVRPPRR